MKTIKLGLMFRYNKIDKKYYNIDNLNISCFYTDSESLDDELIIRKKIKPLILSPMPRISIEDSETENFNKKIIFIRRCFNKKCKN